jgi:hypothetical protein
MTGRNGPFAYLVVAATLCLANLTAWALDPGQPPGSNFDLTHWYLQLPTSNGILTGASGTVDSASASQLVAGFTNAYFYTGPDGAMVFWVPDNGARTGGSAHPRSELREQLIPGNNNTNWTVYGTHVMTAQCTVLQVPSDTQKVCIGQMHEPNTKPDGSPSAGNEQMIMFDLKNHKIYVNINLDGNLSSSFSQTLISGAGVALSNTLSYTMSVVNGLLTIAVNGVSTSWDLLSGTNYSSHIAQNWDLASGNTLYFKAGNYNQTTNLCNCSTNGARVAFYALSRYHAPSITNQPVNQVVAVGSNVTFTVGALGNAPLRYAWQLNGTPLNLATNATLTIPNVQLTNTGNYSVVVIDLVGSVTSSVATLTVLSPAPLAPSGLSATPLSETQVGLTWTDNATNETAYGVERSLDSNSWSVLTANLPPNSAGYTDATCSASSLYYYRVNCTNAGGASAYAVASVTMPDGIGDGIPGWWRLQNFGNGLSTNNSSCATCDPDGDGQDNLAEYLAGTDPNSSASAFRILSIVPLGNDLVITWQTAAAKTNALQATAGTASGGYSDNYADIFVVTNTVGTATNYLDAGALTSSPSRYYRVRLVP